jgi:aminoglycoside 6'-N-acetyltransferase I
MEIRKATKKDLKDIADILRIETAKKPYNQKWNKKSSLEKIKKSFKKDDIYLSELSGIIAGFIICKKNKIQKSIYIDELWFKQEYQRKGLGKQLMKKIEEIYKRNEFKSISLVSDKRTNAFKFYKKIGYRSHSVNVYMEKKLK